MGRDPFRFRNGPVRPSGPFHRSRSTAGGADGLAGSGWKDPRALRPPGEGDGMPRLGDLPAILEADPADAKEPGAQAGEAPAELDGN